MGSHSEHGKFVRGYASRVLNAYGPADAGAVRDGVFSNINHLIDESTQPIANLQRDQGDVWRVKDPSSSQTRPFEFFPQIRFPLMLRPSIAGEPTRSVNVECFVTASISAAGTASIYAQLSLATRPRPALAPGTGIGSMQIVTTSSTTAVDLDFDSLYIGTDVLAAYAAAAGDPGDGPPPYFTRMPGGGAVVLARLSVLARSTTSAQPRIHAFHARQYIGS
jgi:hypothetical protein